MAKGMGKGAKKAPRVKIPRAGKPRKAKPVMERRGGSVGAGK